MSWQLHRDTFVKLRYQLHRSLASLPVRGRSFTASCSVFVYPLYRFVLRYRLHPRHALQDVIGIGSEVNPPHYVYVGYSQRVTSPKSIDVICGPSSFKCRFCPSSSTVQPINSCNEFLRVTARPSMPFCTPSQDGRKRERETERREQNPREVEGHFNHTSTPTVSCGAPTSLRATQTEQEYARTIVNDCESISVKAIGSSSCMFHRARSKQLERLRVFSFPFSVSHIGRLSRYFFPPPCPRRAPRRHILPANSRIVSSSTRVLMISPSCSPCRWFAPWNNFRLGTQIREVSSFLRRLAGALAHCPVLFQGGGWQGILTPLGDQHPLRLQSSLTNRLRQLYVWESLVRPGVSALRRRLGALITVALLPTPGLNARCNSVHTTHQRAHYWGRRQLNYIHPSTAVIFHAECSKSLRGR